MNGRREYGDYQTPLKFAERVCRYLKENRHIAPSAVIDPTCGVGNFLKCSLAFNASEYCGIEINPDYCSQCRKQLAGRNVQIVNADFFSFSLKDLAKDQRQILVLGNPPWVTTSTLSALGSANHPAKTNCKNLKGIEAATGEGSFDICEYIIWRLVEEFKGTKAVIAMLCKTSVARNIFKELKRNAIPFSSCSLLSFDAAKVFGICASACLLVLELAEEGASPDRCTVCPLDDPAAVQSCFGYADGRFYSRLETAAGTAADFDGKSFLEWRQGVKHDCAKVMELTRCGAVFQNGLGDVVQIEEDIVYPLVKSSMFKEPVIRSFSKYVLVTQKKPRESTDYLQAQAPRTWRYLNQHSRLFEGRKSAIYRGAPPFSMFGVGEYSFSRCKVGVSGFYKQPLFSVLCSDDARPVMTDDTSYFICLESYDTAYTAMLMLNSAKVQKFLAGIAFLDAKRPYTKKVLQRLDFGRMTSALTLEDLAETERRLSLPACISLSMYNAFKSLQGMKTP